MTAPHRNAFKGSTGQCPKCGCREVFVARGVTLHGYGPDLARCKNCDALWEPFNDEPEDHTP